MNSDETETKSVLAHIPMHYCDESSLPTGNILIPCALDIYLKIGHVTNLKVSAVEKKWLILVLKDQPDSNQ